MNERLLNMSSRKQFRYNNRKCRSNRIYYAYANGNKTDTDDAILLLRQNLQEEEEMFGWLRANAPTIFL
jgi:hypothetical protein